MMAKPHMKANYIVQNFTCAAEKSLSTFDCDIYTLVITCMFLFPYLLFMQQNSTGAYTPNLGCKLPFCTKLLGLH